MGALASWALSSLEAGRCSVPISPHSPLPSSGQPGLEPPSPGDPLTDPDPDPEVQAAGERWN